MLLEEIKTPLMNPEDGLDRHLLNVYCVPGNLLSTGNIALK